MPTVDNSTGIKGATLNTSVLTTQYAVRDYVDNELAEKVAGVRVSVSTGTKEYVNISVNETGRDISVGVITASLGDYADLTFNTETGKWVTEDGSVYPDGLAIASDVAEAIQENEKVVATALNTFKDKLGLKNDLSIDWAGKYEAGTTIVDAIKGINVGDDITDAIEALDSSVAATAGSVLTKVVQEDGKLKTATAATLKINNVQFTGTSTEISAEINAGDIKLMDKDEFEANGGSVENIPTVKQAILDLHDSKIGDILTGNNAAVTDVNLMELTGAFTKHTIDSRNHTVNDTKKDASIFTELLVTKTNTAATALATDAYVLEKIETAVSGALVWEEF